MPLNPNGKVDKPALPFPDTAQLAAASRQSRKDGAANNISMSSTEQVVRGIWLSVIPHSPRDLEITDNFFDVGGHSILATRVVFEIRKRFAIDLPLGILFRQPTISGLSHEIDLLAGGSLGMASRPSSSHGTDLSVDYSADAVALRKRLPTSYKAARSSNKEDQITVFLTGATGFLGSFLIRDLLSRQGGKIRVIAHVRAKTAGDGLQRLKNTCEAYGVWKSEWSSRIQVVTGSLEQNYLGLSESKWADLVAEVDVIIHNGAMVSVLVVRLFI
jgi:L-aminoadipate-semialdehyde dehydrogenase